MRWIILLLTSSAWAQAQTAEDEISTMVYATLTAAQSQTVGFDYSITAGDVYLANLLTFIAFSIWAMFIFCVLIFFLVARRR